MRLDDGAADGKAHAQSVALGRVKRLKNFIHFHGTHAGAVVAYGNPYHARVFYLRKHFDFTILSRTIFHRVNRIKQQVEEDLLQLNLVAANKRQRGIEIEKDADVVQDGVAVD